MVDASSSEAGVGWFEVPADAVARHPNVILSPRELKRWFDTLPMANPSRAAGMLQQQLQMLVRDPEPGGRFAAMLDLYEQPIGDLLDIVHDRQRQNLDSALPLDQLEHLVLETLLELAYGRLRQANAKLTLDKAPDSATLSCAMVALDFALNIEHQHYHKVSGETWQLIMGILRHAEHWQFAEEPIETPLLDREGPQTIRALAMRALVLELCDPNHHRPQQVARWRRWCGRRCNELVMTPLPQGNAAVPVDITGEMSPLAAARRGKPGQHTRYLSTDTLFEQLRDDPESPAGLLAALNNLIQGRRTPEQRQAARQPRQQGYRLLHGIRNMHQRLTELMEGRQDDPSEASKIDCQQVNQSKAGSAFALSEPPNPPLTIGEPVLAEACSVKPGGAAVGFAAQIRRLTIDDRGGIEIGVQKLEGRLVPVSYSGGAAERSRGSNQALLLHHAESGRFTLVAPLSVFNEGDIITVEGPGLHYRLRMRGITETARNTAYIAVEAA